LPRSQALSPNGKESLATFVGVKPWTSGSWVLAVPIRLQNDSRDKFSTTVSDVAMPLRTIVRKIRYNDGISSDHRN